MFPLRPRNYLSLLLSFKERLLLNTLYPLTIMQTILVALVTFVWLISLPGVRFHSLKVRISSSISYHTPFTPPLWSFRRCVRLLPFLQPDLSREESEDEGVNRSCSTLSCLKRVCLFSPVCEKRAVALVFQAIKEQFLDRDLVTKVRLF